MHSPFNEEAATASTEPFLAQPVPTVGVVGECGLEKLSTALTFMQSRKFLS